MYLSDIDPSTADDAVLGAELDRLRAAFNLEGGRGVELAEDIDTITAELERRRTLAIKRTELNSVEYLLANGLWDDDTEREELRKRQTDLLDWLADNEGTSA